MCCEEYRFLNQLVLKFPLNSKCGPSLGEVFLHQLSWDSDLTEATNLHLVGHTVALNKCEFPYLVLPNIHSFNGSQ